MKYKIVVDKQSRMNPSNEKREYEIDIEELRVKGDIYDSICITKDESYVTRRLKLNEYQVLNVLEKERKELLEDLNIELFEGENYLYLEDKTENKIYAEYLVKNDFNEIYVTNNRMDATIEIKVNQIKEEVSSVYATQVSLLEERSQRTQTETQIKEEVEKKVDDKTITGAYLMLRINKDESEAKIDADKIKISANDVLNILANNEINLTSKNTTISSTNFSIDKNGNITAKSGIIGGFTLDSTKFSTTINGIYDYNLYDVRIIQSMLVGYIGENSILSNICDEDESGEVDVNDGKEIVEINLGTRVNKKRVLGTFQINSSNPKNFISIKNENNLAVSIGVGGINAHFISAENIICSTQLVEDDFTGVAINGKSGVIYANNIGNISLESVKKNITKFEDALEIIKNAEIYEYNFKNEEEGQKKHIGFIIGNKYKTPDIVKSSDGKAIESYSMSAIEWKAIQELTEKVEKLYEKWEV